MREIKFRAWEISTKKMRTIMAINWDYETGKVEDVSCCEGYGGSYHYDPDDYILMQFTGLCDKNGKEIYEGDLVRNSHYGWDQQKVHEVSWNYDGIALSGAEIADATRHELEVIGNIYENP